jgi:PAS domain S-box-containing protein
LSYGEFALLTRAISEVAGPAGADDVLFRVGRRWGEAEAGLVGAESNSTEERLREGLAKLQQLGLGRVVIDQLVLGTTADSRLVGHVLDPLEAAAPHAQAGHKGPACGLTVGFVTGLTAGLSGLDFVCSPFHCSQDCGLCGCGFEIRPAQGGLPEPGDPAPAGSARFFLGSMGRGMAEADLSLGDLLEGTSDAVILLDKDHVIRFWNQGAETMFQYPRDDVIGEPAGFILPQDLRERDELGEIQELLAQGGSLNNFVTRRVRRDGTELWVSLTRSLLHDSAGATIGSTAVIRDITEQKRVETELGRARSLAMIGELAAKIAHEVKNPLAGIYTAVQLLARDHDADDPKREIFDNVSQEIHRLDETIGDLLSFARPVPPKPTPTDLRSFLGDLSESLKRQPQIQPHRLDVAIREGLVVGIDARLMVQVFSNLILNAGQAMQEPGTIHITARPSNGRVEVEVADEGPGISAEQLEQIFEPFYTTKTRGTGLGLCIAAKNVAAHGGRLEADSPQAGGARFRFSLPFVESINGGD